MHKCLQFADLKELNHTSLMSDDGKWINGLLLDYLHERLFLNKYPWSFNFNWNTTNLKEHIHITWLCMDSEWRRAFKIQTAGEIR